MRQSLIRLAPLVVFWGCLALAGCASAPKPEEKRKVSGEVFIASQGGQNYKLGSIEVVVFKLEDVQKMVADSRAEVESTRKGLEAQYLPIRERLDHLESRVQRAKEKLQSLEEPVRKAEADYRENHDLATAKAQAAAHDAQAQAKIELSQYELDLATYRVETYSTVATYDRFPSGKWYFDRLIFPVQKAFTDSNGKFSFELPPGTDFVVGAVAERKVGDTTENYAWIVRVPPAGKEINLNLSNQNLTTTGENGSMVKSKS